MKIYPGLEVVLLLGVLGVQAQGVEAEVTGGVGVIVVELVEAPANTIEYQPLLDLLMNV